jgi:hypothetical protein
MDRNEILSALGTRRKLSYKWEASRITTMHRYPD